MFLHLQAKGNPNMHCQQDSWCGIGHVNTYDKIFTDLSFKFRGYIVHIARGTESMCPPTCICPDNWKVSRRPCRHIKGDKNIQIIGGKPLFLNPLNRTKLVKYHTNIDITSIDETKHETLVVTVIVV